MVHVQWRREKEGNTGHLQNHPQISRCRLRIKNPKFLLYLSILIQTCSEQMELLMTLTVLWSPQLASVFWTEVPPPENMCIKKKDATSLSYLVIMSALGDKTHSCSFSVLEVQWVVKSHSLAASAFNFAKGQTFLKWRKQDLGLTASSF